MGEEFVFIEIVVFAMIAAFLVYRLRSVLGRRNGEERPRPNPFTPHPPQAVADNVVPMPERARAAVTPAPVASDEPQSLSALLERVAAADPAFDEKRFLGGARGAFQMIVEGYSKGDTQVLRPLLADDVFASFSRAIAQRQQAGEVMEAHIERIKEAEIVQARLEGFDATLTVRFVSEQLIARRDAEGRVIEGDPAHPVEVTDLWSFRRDIRARDPAWILVETRTPN